LKIESELGRGQFGIVYRGKYQGVTDVAIKKLKSGESKDWDPKQIKEFFTEMKTME